MNWKGMGVTIAGAPVSGKDTNAELLSKKTGLPLIKASLKRFSTEMGIDILEFEKKYSKDQDKWDKKIDEWTREEVKKHSETGYVLVSMLSAYNAPKADLKVWLYCRLNERGNRVANRDGVPAEKASAYIADRDKTFLARIQKLYGINPWSLEYYDLVVNTEFWQPEQVSQIILSAMKEKRDKK